MRLRVLYLQTTEAFAVALAIKPETIAKTATKIVFFIFLFFPIQLRPEIILTASATEVNIIIYDLCKKILINSPTSHRV
jgi:hypothetical protein